jgi:hypothetical protein
MVSEVPCRLYTLTASNGDPLLLFGEDDNGNVMLWPMTPITSHPIEFARWSRRYVQHWRGKTIRLQHPLCEQTLKWAQWLGVTFQHDVAYV